MSEIEITYTAELSVPNECIKRSWLKRAQDWRSGELHINTDPFLPGNYIARPAHQSINTTLPEWCACTYNRDANIPGYSCVFQIDADTPEQLRQRIKQFKRLVLKRGIENDGKED